MSETVQVFTVGHNMPGYLPEADNWSTTDWDSAKRACIDKMERDADFYDDYADVRGAPEFSHDLAEELSAICEDLNLSGGPDFGAIVGNVAYWIEPSVITVAEWEEIERGQ